MATDPDWELVEELGGEQRLHELMTRFYDRLFADMMIGFFFTGLDKAHLVDSQISYIRARLGGSRTSYEGPPIRKAHQHLPILVGHFDRRHQILKEVLTEYQLADHVRDAWLGLDASLRDLIVRTGNDARERMLKDQ
ncbi:MAG: group 1 truncated hemoglobin [Bradymonadaceae bacterium]|nr:group 1 truncated hemoglobin [Lujinxingiaceae bacterium]